MAGRDGEVFNDLITIYDSVHAHGRAGELAASASSSARYLMVGTDAATTQEGTWPVTGSADTTGAQYTGPRATPLRFIRILKKTVVVS